MNAAGARDPFFLVEPTCLLLVCRSIPVTCCSSVTASWLHESHARPSVLNQFLSPLFFCPSQRPFSASAGFFYSMFSLLLFGCPFCPCPAPRCRASPSTRMLQSLSRVSRTESILHFVLLFSPRPACSPPCPPTCLRRCFYVASLQCFLVFLLREGCDDASPTTGSLLPMPGAEGLLGEPGLCFYVDHFVSGVKQSRPVKVRVTPFVHPTCTRFLDTIQIV